MPLAVMESINEDTAVEKISRYFTVLGNGRPLYTGSQFDAFDGGGDVNDPHRITAEDLIAVSMLSVHVPGQAALGILGSCAKELGKQLQLLPLNLNFEKLTDAEFLEYLGEGSPADLLWKILRQEGDRWGVGPTMTSKILARKRPHLIPIYDSVIARKIGMNGSGAQWDRWHRAFHGDQGRGNKLVSKLVRIRDSTGQNHLSLLRVMDIVLWMGDQKSDIIPEAVSDEE